MESLLWVLVFIVSLALLVKGSDWLIEKAEKIGYRVGLSAFVIGVIIIAIGTSLPEIATGIAAVLRGSNEIVVANAIGSNITNILLVVGLSAVLAGRLRVGKNLINVELPLLAVASGLFFGAAWDQLITLGEAVILVGAAVVYIIYAVRHDEYQEMAAEGEHIPTRTERRREEERGAGDTERITFSDVVLLVAGAAGVVLGAHYLVESVVTLAELFAVGVGVITLIGVAIGTSLPELVVSARAAMQRRSEMALGNIFGSNVFNMLLVVGLPGLITPLPFDTETYRIALPMLVLVTILFIFSATSRRIYAYEGAMYILFYALFIGKLLGSF